MYLLGLGIILLVLKMLEIAPVAEWSWWGVLAPFAAAVLWWLWADRSGYTKRKAAQRDEERRRARAERNREQLGLGTRKRR